MAALSIAAAAVPARAEQTLAEVLATARAQSPRVAAGRATAGAREEGVAIARSGWLPTVTASADFGLATEALAPSLERTGSTRPAGFGITASQPLFDGGRTAAAVGQASAVAAGEHERHRLTDQQVLLAAATSFADVRLGRRLVTVHERTHALLRSTRDATRRMLAAREATAADLAQAEAALARIDARRLMAAADLAASEAAFEAATTRAPGKLAAVPSLATRLPSSASAAIAEAERSSPGVVLAVHTQAAAAFALERARAERLPSLGIEASWRRRYDAPSPISEPDGFAVRAVVTVPLLRGGATEAGIRAAALDHAAARYQAGDAKAEARRAVAQAWSRLAAVRASLRSLEAQVAASRKALEGVSAEQKVGQRTVQELIVAQQAVLAAETELAEAVRNRVVAECSLLATLGHLDPALFRHRAAAGLASSGHVTVGPWIVETRHAARAGPRH
ncbi:MAG: TolC family protein [Hyphomicrobiaceae bacterium]